MQFTSKVSRPQQPISQIVRALAPAAKVVQSGHVTQSNKTLATPRGTGDIMNALLDHGPEPSPSVIPRRNKPRDLTGNISSTSLVGLSHLSSVCPLVGLPLPAAGIGLTLTKQLKRTFLNAALSVYIWISSKVGALSARPPHTSAPTVVRC